jgi:hypothetical protein
VNPWEKYEQQAAGPWAKYGKTPEPETSVPRMVGLGAQGINDAIANTAGAPVDLVAAGLRQVGVPVDRPIGGSESLKSGIDYVATLPGRAVDAFSQRSLDPFTEDRTSRLKPENRAERIAGGTGEGIGQVASVMFPAGRIAQALAPRTAARGVAETLAAMPKTQLTMGVAGGATTGATDDPLAGLAAALAVPVGIGVIRRGVTPITQNLNANERGLIAAAGNEGIPLTAAQRTGSPTLRGLEETMSRIPGSAGTMRGTFDDQHAAFNRAVMERTGTAADNAGPDTLRRVSGDLGQTFDNLAARTTLNIDQQFADDIVRTATEYGRRLPTDVAPVFTSYMDDLQPIINMVARGMNPRVSGEVYQTVRSNLTTRIRNATNPDLKDALGGIVQALDDAVTRSAAGNPTLAAEWNQVRGQYSAYKTVDRAMSGGTQADRSAADIPYGAFSQAVKGADREGYARGRGQYGELAKLADYLAPRVPNSGTPERLMWANLLTGGTLGGGALAGGASPEIAMATAAATAAAPNVAARLYNSGRVQSYLSNQAMPQLPMGPVIASQAVRSGLDAIPGGGDSRALARALMRANEKRVAR